MKINLAGRVQNTHLPYQSALLPLLEAIINAIHAIEDLGTNEGRIDIYLERDETQLFFEETQIPPIKNIVVEDNGIGFTADNFKSFQTSDSSFKRTKGAKGIGRFVWLKAFKKVQVDSQFQENGRYWTRIFDFVLSENGFENVQLKEIETTEPKTRIKLQQFKEEYQRAFPKTIDAVALRIIEHYLIYFISEACPLITIHDSENGQTMILNALYEKGISPHLLREKFQAKYETFEIINVKVYLSRRQNRSEIHLCANYRDVLTEKLGKWLPDVDQITDEDGKRFVFIAYISSQYLDYHVNAERTDFLLEDEEGFWVSKSDIIRSAINHIKNNYLKHYLAKIQQTKQQRIDSYIKTTAPQYRHLLKYQAASLSEIPLKSLDDGSIDLELYKRSAKIELELKEKGQKFLSRPLTDIKDLASYKAEYNKYIEQENDLGKAKLAQYIAHRKIILTLLSNSLERGDDGKYSLEESVHGLIFPLRQTSDDIDYEKHNLWIIDEKLAYHKYLASDLPLNQLGIVDVDSLERPDLIIFDSHFALVEDSTPFSSVVIVEFKRPLRKNYPKEENPIEQVCGYIEKIQGGTVTNKAGRPIPVNRNTPFYCYIICDITEKIKRHARVASLTPMPSGTYKGYFGYIPPYNAYIEILSYDKLLEDAKKRNQILFDKLNLPC
ncbi:MAG: ATP-binding protein [Thiomargarita sp.]|nr:ATP-binding protein [Thiomargarita sp.]